MIECSLNQIVCVKHIMPVEMQMHIHKSDELTYYISGNGSTTIRNTDYEYKPNTFAFSKAGTAHNEINPHPSEIIWTHFSYNIGGISLREGIFEHNRHSI